MMYGSYCQNIPGSMMQYNFGFQGMPGSLLNNNMLNNYPNPNIIDLNGNSSTPLSEINSRINNLENRIRLIEQRLSNNDSYKDDNSMYMI